MRASLTSSRTVWVFYVLDSWSSLAQNMIGHVTMAAITETAILVTYPYVKSLKLIWTWCLRWFHHYSDIIMSATASQITGVSVVCSNVWSGAEQRKHQSSASLTFRGIHRYPIKWWIVGIYFGAHIPAAICLLTTYEIRNVNIKLMALFIFIKDF